MWAPSRCFVFIFFLKTMFPLLPSTYCFLLVLSQSVSSQFPFLPYYCYFFNLLVFWFCFPRGVPETTSDTINIPVWVPCVPRGFVLWRSAQMPRSSWNPVSFPNQKVFQFFQPSQAFLLSRDFTALCYMLPYETLSSLRMEIMLFFILESSQAIELILSRVFVLPQSIEID